LQATTIWSTSPSARSTRPATAAYDGLDDRPTHDPERIPEQIVANVRLLHSLPPDWSARINNSSLTPEEALTEIANRVAAGHGEITAPRLTADQQPGASTLSVVLVTGSERT
jgi:hypothetical protein